MNKIETKNGKAMQWYSTYAQYSHCIFSFVQAFWRSLDDFRHGFWHQVYVVPGHQHTGICGFTQSSSSIHRSSYSMHAKPI
ncbi:hypothetical protein DL98DRAFT_229170 [Cadophora sp. DSE1049]|nr:hypothetical protein DL98DRAFT_229170 [Cadophora sp. DSE1049]